MAGLDVSFNNVHTVPAGVPAEVAEHIETRTPALRGGRWSNGSSICDDGAAFLGAAGRKELESYPDALEMLRHGHAEYGWPSAQVEEHVQALDGHGQPTAYRFRCRQCGTHLAYGRPACSRRRAAAQRLRTASTTPPPPVARLGAPRFVGGDVETQATTSATTAKCVAAATTTSTWKISW